MQTTLNTQMNTVPVIIVKTTQGRPVLLLFIEEGIAAAGQVKLYMGLSENLGWISKGYKQPHRH